MITREVMGSVEGKTPRKEPGNIFLTDYIAMRKMPN
jgi:hypothetical protein